MSSNKKSRGGELGTFQNVIQDKEEKVKVGLDFFSPK